MVCSISVSATGIVAVLLEFPISVANTSRIVVGSVEGDLYGTRTGDNSGGYTGHIYKYGSGIDQTTLDYFCKDVSFNLGSNKIEYVFKFIQAADAEGATFITLTNTGMNNEVCYSTSYKVAHGVETPNWDQAENMTPNKVYIADTQNPYIWLKATISINSGAYQRLDTSATWTFTYNFEGAVVSGS